MQLPASAIGPFALLLHPEAVFTAMQRSERLNRLHSRICHPLDRPLSATAAAAEDEVELSDDAEAAAQGPEVR